MLDVFNNELPNTCRLSLLNLTKNTGLHNLIIVWELVLQNKVCMRSENVKP